MHRGIYDDYFVRCWLSVGVIVVTCKVCCGDTIITINPTLQNWILKCFNQC
jgi:hypothetical protein